MLVLKLTDCWVLGEVLKLIDGSKANMLGVRYKFVNFGAETDRHRDEVADVASVKF